MICKECGKEVSSTVALVAHIVSHHDKKKYYDKWIKSKVEEKCLNCGNPTEYSGRWNRGYKKFCSDKCRFKYVNNNPAKIKMGNESTRKYYQEKFGVDYYTQTSEFKEKSKKKWLDLYGVDNPSKNEEIFKKQQRSSFHVHKHNKTNLFYQGSYELDFLEKFHNNINIKEGIKVPYFSEKARIYFSDFYISQFNLIVEIKSSYHYKKDIKRINIKKKACIEAGFSFILIIDKNYEEFISNFLST